VSLVRVGEGIVCGEVPFNSYVRSLYKTEYGVGSLGARIVSPPKVECVSVYTHTR